MVIIRLLVSCLLWALISLQVPVSIGQVRSGPVLDFDSRFLRTDTRTVFLARNAHSIFLSTEVHKEGSIEIYAFEPSNRGLPLLAGGENVQRICGSTNEQVLCGGAFVERRWIVTVFDKTFWYHELDNGVWVRTKIGEFSPKMNPSLSVDSSGRPHFFVVEPVPPDSERLFNQLRVLRLDRNKWQDVSSEIQRMIPPSFEVYSNWNSCICWRDRDADMLLVADINSMITSAALNFVALPFDRHCKIAHVAISKTMDVAIVYERPEFPQLETQLFFPLTKLAVFWRNRLDSTYSRTQSEPIQIDQESLTNNITNVHSVEWSSASEVFLLVEWKENAHLVKRDVERMESVESYPLADLAGEVDYTISLDIHGCNPIVLIRPRSRP